MDAYICVDVGAHMLVSVCMTNQYIHTYNFNTAKVF